MPPDPDQATVARPTGRPSVERAAEMSDAFIDATISLFGQHGMAFSMDQVAAVAGISKQAIYRRWPSKLDLLIHAIEWTIERANPALPAVLPEEPLAALRELAWRLFDDGWNNRYRVSVFIQVEALRNERLLERVGVWRAQHVAAIAEQVSAVIGKDKKTPTAIDLAQMLMDLIDSANELIALKILPSTQSREIFEQRWAAFMAILKAR